MNEQQQIGYRTLITTAERLAAERHLGHELRRARSVQRPETPAELREIAEWAEDEMPCGGPGRLEFIALRDDCRALARWIEGRL